MRVKLVHIPHDHTIDEDGLQRTVVWSDVVTFSVLHPDSDEGAVAEEEETAATAAHRSITGGGGDIPLVEAGERGGGSRGGGAYGVFVEFPPHMHYFESEKDPHVIFRVPPPTCLCFFF